MTQGGPAHSSTVAQESREEIISAAAELFTQFGFAATSIDAVAEKLGGTKGMIYHHFKSKADLFIEVQVAAMLRLHAAIEPIALQEAPPVRRLTEMALCHTRLLLNELPLMKVAVQGLERGLLKGSSVAKRLRDVVKLRDGYEKLFSEVIDQGIREGVFMDTDPAFLAKPFFGAMNWATIWYSPRRLQSKDSIEYIAQTLTMCAVKGILKESRHEPEIQAALLGRGMG